jgi:hypothetical protein
LFDRVHALWCCFKNPSHRYTPRGGKTAIRSALKPPKLKEITVKNTLRAALVVLTLAGAYAGLTAPAPAMTNPKPTITIADGGAPVPTTPNYPVPTTPTSPTSPKSSSQL